MYLHIIYNMTHFLGKLLVSLKFQSTSDIHESRITIINKGCVTVYMLESVSFTLMTIEAILSALVKIHYKG